MSNITTGDTKCKRVHLHKTYLRKDFLRERLHTAQAKDFNHSLLQKVAEVENA